MWVTKSSFLRSLQHEPSRPQGEHAVHAVVVPSLPAAGVSFVREWGPLGKRLHRNGRPSSPIGGNLGEESSGLPFSKLANGIAHDRPFQGHDALDVRPKARARLCYACALHQCAHVHHPRGILTSDSHHSLLLLSQSTAEKAGATVPRVGRENSWQPDRHAPCAHSDANKSSRHATRVGPVLHAVGSSPGTASFVAIRPNKAGWPPPVCVAT